MTPEERIWDKIDHLRKFVDVDGIITGEKNSDSEIRNYFKINEKAYRKLHSKQGFMHFCVCPDGKFSEDGALYQPNLISSYIKPGSKVLELGSGQSPNLLYLAAKHPDVQFYGLDLYPVVPENLPANIHVMQQNYSDLSVFADGCFDVVYAIETLVHNTGKDPVFREAFRVLKPGGVFIVYDYALSRPYEEYDPKTQTAISLVSKGGAGAIIECQDSWTKHFASHGFVKERTKDLTKEIAPDLQRHDVHAAHVLKRPFLARIVFSIFPQTFTNNMILGYLAYDACMAGILGSYMEWIYRKPTA